MKGCSYRYYAGTPVYPFGTGQPGTGVAGQEAPLTLSRTAVLAQ